MFIRDPNYSVPNPNFLHLGSVFFLSRIPDRHQRIKFKTKNSIRNTGLNKSLNIPNLFFLSRIPSPIKTIFPLSIMRQIHRMLRSSYLTDPVDVVLAVVGIIVVYDKLDVVHVQTAGRHVCCHQDTRGSGPAHRTQTIN
jgi:hypothetical protein